MPSNPKDSPFFYHFVLSLDLVDENLFKVNDQQKIGIHKQIEAVLRQHEIVSDSVRFVKVNKISYDYNQQKAVARNYHLTISSFTRPPVNCIVTEDLRPTFIDTW